VVIDNGAGEDIAAAAAAEFAGFAKVVTLGANTGSANGYRVGMETALAEGAAYLLLIDDDNVLLPGALAALRRAHADKRAAAPLDNLCVYAYRPDHQPTIAAGLPTGMSLNPPDSFLRFHIADVPFKIWRRIPFVKRYYARRAAIEDCRVVRMESGPYSGLYFHRAVVDRHGFPETQLVLYSDDSEFYYRVRSSGGQIWLVVDARIEDLEKSWNVAKPFRSTFEGWLYGEGDRRIYYASRNLAWFGAHRLTRHPAIRQLNKAIYLAAMWLLAKKWRREERFSLIVQAVRDGEAQRLGIHERYPL